jgi:2-hydroxy-4-carboxymuconate semialdehyde hemiacetal dehydrogenase
MTQPIKVALAGAGAFGIKHLDGIRNIDGVEVVSLVGRRREPTQAVADKYGIAHVATDLAESLARPDVDAVILCTPTQMHAAQAIACLQAGKHVQVEIPLCDKLADGQRVLDAQRRPAAWPCAATRAASTPATSTCTRKSRRAHSTSSRWMCRPTSSAAPT